MVSCKKGRPERRPFCHPRLSTVCFKTRPGHLDGRREVSPDTMVSQKSYGFPGIGYPFSGAFFSSFLPDSFFAMSLSSRNFVFLTTGRQLQSPRQSLGKYSELLTLCK